MDSWFSEEQIRAHLQGFVEKGIVTSYSVPDRIVFVEALPKTSVGKLDKKVMRERHAPIQDEGMKES